MDCRFLLFCLPRTGSTNLAKALNVHPNVRCIIEPFNKRTPRPYRYYARLATEASLRRCVEKLRLTYNGIKHVWEPNGWPFRRAALNHVLAAMPDQHVIVLNRRNVLKRLVSDQISRQLDIWDVREPENRERVQRCRFRPLDIERIHDGITIERAAIADYLELFTRCGTHMMRLWYEDIFPEFDETGSTALRAISKILEFTGHRQPDERLCRDMLQYLTVSSRMNSIETYSRIPNIDDVERSLGSNATGWLFKDIAAEGL